MGIGFTAGQIIDFLLTIALAVELINLEIAAAAGLGNDGSRKEIAVEIIFGLSMVFFIDTILGETLLHILSDSEMEIVLSFGLSALFFRVTEKLLTEAHKEKETV